MVAYYRAQQRHRNLPVMVHGYQYQKAGREVIKNARYVHVLQTEGVFRQLYREIARIWLLRHPFVGIFTLQERIHRLIEGAFDWGEE